MIQPFLRITGRKEYQDRVPVLVLVLVQDPRVLVTVLPRVDTGLRQVS